MSNVDMRKGPLLKQIILFAIPVLISGFMQHLFHISDLLVVGNFAGTNALAAVGATGSLCNMLVNFFIGLSMGSGVVASHFFGADDHKNLSRGIHTAFISSCVFGIVLVFIGLFFSKPILRLMNTPEDILADASLYMSIYFLGMPGNMIFNFLNSISRSVGDTKRPMIYLLLSGVINVILNLIFVIIFKMSVAGVAIATIIAQYISALLMIIKFAKSEYPLKLNIKTVVFDKNIIKKILFIGLPAGIQSTAVALSNVIIQSSVNFFGSSAVAGYTAGSNIGVFIYITLNSFYQTSMTLTAQNYGCRNYGRIKKGTFLCLMSTLTIGILMSITVLIFKEPLLKIYTDDPLSLKTGFVYYNIIAATYTLCGIMEVMTGTLRGMGKSILSMLVLIGTMSVFRIIWNLTVFQWIKTVEVAFITYPISWILAIILLGIPLYKLFKGFENC